MIGDIAVEPLNLHPYSKLPFLVVTGLGRSGTTVLRNCIAAHPEIDSHNWESNYLSPLMRNANLASEDQGITENLAVPLSDFWLYHRELVLRLCWPQPHLDADLPRAISTYSMLDPRAAMALTMTFDRLSLLYIIRNGIEVISSYQAFRAFQHLPFEQVCKLWKIRYDMFQYCRDNDHAHLLRYEWLTEDQDRWEACIDESLQQIGLRFHADCRKPLANRFHPTRFDGESHRDSKEPGKRKDRWRYWTDEQRTQFVEICGEPMRDLGYDIPWETE